MNNHKPTNSPFNQDLNSEDDIDYDLVDFLRSNHPIAPSAHPNLQAQIMLEVSITPIEKIGQEIKWKNIFKIGLASSVIAAMGVIIFNQPNQTMQTAQNQAENLKNEKSLEKSLITNWHLPDEEFTTSYSILSSANYE